MILNLIVNAVDAVSDNQFKARLVTIKTAEDGNGNVDLFVSDTGPGIEAEAAKRIFDPFFTTKHYGLGLGLSISRTIAEAHGGSLEAFSDLDNGLRFRLRLPAGESGKKSPPAEVET